MRLKFEEYETRKLINVHKHVDGPWFWGRYTAHPYVGCRNGCEFCYTRGGKYLGRMEPDDFDKVIRVKVNAVDRMRRELPKLPHEIITTGDWQQPAETRYRLSRQLLEVVLEHEFPLFVIERSPLITRDLDLLTDIDARANVTVAWSFSTVDPALKRAFEPRAPGIRKRLRAMAELAAAGIRVGATLMPIIPLVGDDTAQIDETIRAIADHGGTFVLAGGMTMAGAQADRTLAAARAIDPGIEPRWREFFRWQPGCEPAYGPPPAYNAQLGLLVRELCARRGVRDRIPRYITPGPLAVNKRLAEQLFLRTYDLELERASKQRIWLYRKAAWTMDELDRPATELYEQEGVDGLRGLDGIAPSLVGPVERWLRTAVARRGEPCD
jgi:DNA repair photolyase